MACRRRDLVSGSILIAWLALPLAASAQSTEPAWRLTAKGGATSSTLVYSEGGDFFDPIVGAVAGVAVDIPIVGRWGLGAVIEGLYSRGGAKDSITGDRLVIDRIEIPILAKVRAGSLGGARVFGVGGISFGRQVKATFRDIDVADDYESMNLSVVGGGGVGFGRWSVEGRGSWGRKSIYKLPAVDVRTRAISILVGYRLR